MRDSRLDSIQRHVSTERLNDAGDDAYALIDEADFMQEHFGLEPDHFTDLLMHLS